MGSVDKEEVAIAAFVVLMYGVGLAFLGFISYLAYVLVMHFAG